MIIGFLNTLIKELSVAIGVALALLPDTPFDWVIGGEMAMFLNTINYFIPFASMVTMLTAYVGAVAVWYIARWVLRIVQYIQ